MEKTLLAYTVKFKDGLKVRKHEWHEDYRAANKRIKYLLNLNKDNQRTIKYHDFITYSTKPQNPYQ